MTVVDEFSPPEIMQEMCDTIASAIQAVVSFIGNGRRIAGSSATERICAVHDGAAGIMRAEIDDAETPRAFPNLEHPIRKSQGEIRRLIISAPSGTGLG